MKSRPAIIEATGLAILSATLTLSLALAVSAWAAQPEGPKRSKVIDFEGELVEGMNKKPLDSLAQITDAEKRRRSKHLYRVRRGFRNESYRSLQDLRWQEGFHQ